jgi:CheY-like chemotaxis protein
MSIRILIVEDDIFTIESLKTMLEEIGFEVDIAKNGLIAIEKLESNDYNLIITDIMMPVMDGMQLLNRMKDMCEDTPVIVLTAYDNIENTLTAYQFGVVEVLNKPFDVSELIELIENVIDLY